MPDPLQPKPHETATPPGRAEWIAVIAIAIVGLGLRAAFPGRVTVEHFDEGVYASNIFSGEASGFQYPFRHLYAPPLLPALIEFSLMLFGPAGLGPMLVNIAAGSLTVLLLWRVGRAWFGPAAGLTAAALCAFSDFHILYSRTALTDPLLCLGMLAAVFCIWKTHQTADARWGLAAGIAGGIAWWTKYNGWLPLAVGLSGVVAWQIFTPKKHRAIARNLGIWVGIAAATSAVWSPVWFGLQAEGGYSVVAANHKQYLVGLAGWLDSLTRHFAVHCHYDGWLTCAGFAVAAIAATTIARREHSDTRARACTIAAAILAGCGLATLLGSSAVLTLLAATGILLQTTLLQRTPESTSRDEVASARRLAAWLLAAWFVGLFLTTPLYRPYPRLALPWLMSAWLGCGAFVEFALHSCRQSSEQPRGRRMAIAVGFALVGCALLIFAGGRLTRHGVPGWQPRNAFVGIADELVERASSGRDSNSVFVLYVYGEPGLYYQLAAARSRHGDIEYVVAPVSSLDFPAADSGSKPVPTYLILGPHAARTAGFEDRWETARPRFAPVGDPLTYRASDLVLLNEFTPSEIDNPETRPRQQVRLFRLR